MNENDATMKTDNDSRKSQIKIETPFFCKSLQSDLEVGRCVDMYVEANAFGFKDSVCFKCPQGLRIRQMLAHE